MIDLLQSAYEARGYEWLSEPYALNLFGFRAPGKDVGAWDDVLGCARRAPRDGGEVRWELYLWRGTTDPGRTREGIATLAAGQYRRVWRRGLHKGKHAAFVQRGAKVRVHRNGRPGIDAGWFGINGHSVYGRAVNSPPERVGAWSEGCQVWRTPEDLTEALTLLDQQYDEVGEAFVSYTLFDMDAAPSDQEKTVWTTIDGQF